MSAKSIFAVPAATNGVSGAIIMPKPAIALQPEGGFSFVAPFSLADGASGLVRSHADPNTSGNSETYAVSSSAPVVFVR